MFRTQASRFRSQRRGVILIVVLAMLTLFAILGITFVMVAQSQALAARYARQGETLNRADLDPEGAFALFLGQFLYDLNDNDQVGIYSGLRGHSLARNMYGWNDWSVSTFAVPTSNPAIQSGPPNDKPYSGTGRIHAANSVLKTVATNAQDTSSPYPTDGSTGNTLDPTTNQPGMGWFDEAFLMNYTYFPLDYYIDKATSLPVGVLRDPERQPRTGQPASLPTATASIQPYTGGANVPYTYPDHQNFYLAQMDPATGMIVAPSFHREYLFGRLDLQPSLFETDRFNGSTIPPPTPNNPNWNNTIGKYMTLRPRPIDQLMLDEVKTATPAAEQPNLPQFFPYKWPGNSQATLWTMILQKQQGQGFWYEGDALNPQNPQKPLKRTLFPYPVDRGGDVKNLDGAPGGCDSIWIDIGAPVMQTPDGRKYKMLVAPLILELDSRVNLNVIGNLMGTDPNTNLQAHRSNQGWGVWEVNPSLVLNVDLNEWRALFQGSSPAGTARIRGRYDSPPLHAAQAAVQLGGTNRVRGWAQVDYNAMVDANGSYGGKAITKGDQSYPFLLPKNTQTLPLFPAWDAPTVFPNDRVCYNDGKLPNAGSPNENLNHASLYNVFRPTDPNRLLPLRDMAALLRFGGTNSDMLPTDLLRLLPTNLVNDPVNPANALKRRNQITLHSCDLYRPAVMPYAWDPTVSPYASTLSAGLAPTSSRYSLKSNAAIAFQDPSTSRNTNPPSGSDFDRATWRSLNAALAPLKANGSGVNIPAINAALARVNLNRTLAEFPDRLDPAHANEAAALTKFGGSMDTVNMTQQIQQAIQDRQQFAQDIFDALRAATGALDPNTAFSSGVSSTQYCGLRQLAQIAVNIVDYIDVDGYSTCFPWNQRWIATTPGMTLEYVFGVELPRLVLNEVFAQYDNTVGTALIADGNGGMMINTAVAGQTYQMNVWLEMFNPLTDDSNLSSSPDATARVYFKPNLGAAASPGETNLMKSLQKNGPYQVLLCATSLNKCDSANNPMSTGWIRDPLNTSGGVAAASINSTVSSADNWGSTLPTPNPDTVAPGTFAVAGPNQTTANILGPPNLPSYPNFDSPQNNVVTHSIPSDNAAKTGLTFTMPVVATADTVPGLTIVLQRLANPALPLNTSVGTPLYNPYITVDVMDLSQTPVYTTTTPNPQTPQVMDARYFTTAAQPNTKYVALADRKSFGRSQPFAGDGGQRLSQRAMDYTNAVVVNPYAQFNQPWHTLKAHNQLDGANTYNTLKQPFDWLTHMDRKLINPIELLHVADCKPAELTTLFSDGNAMANPDQKKWGTVQGHVAPWTDQTSRLYRFLEFAQAAYPRGYGVAPLGRTPGKVNLNGVWSPETFRALADAQRGNGYTATGNPNQVEQFFQTLIKTRNPSAGPTITSDANGYVTGVTLDLRPTNQLLATLAQKAGLVSNSVVDKPFWSLGIGYSTGSSDALDQGSSPPTRGTASTLLGLPWDVPGAGGATNHPYMAKELLRKIYNSVTTRSNVFAVWVTVGYFEVRDDTSRPVKLGAEMGKLENRAVRHRMFAIIDRTNMMAFSTTTTPKPTGQDITIPAGQSTVNAAVSLQWSMTTPQTPPNTPARYFVTDDRPGSAGRAWQVTTGTVLVYEPNKDYDPNTNSGEETVVVQADSAGNLTANFTLNHPAGCTVICRGNPGPWARYDPKNDPDVVPYFALID